MFYKTLISDFQITTLSKNVTDSHSYSAPRSPGPLPSSLISLSNKLRANYARVYNIQDPIHRYTAHPFSDGQWSVLDVPLVRQLNPSKRRGRGKKKK